MPATRQRWHSRPYISRSWYSIKRPRRDARLSCPSWLVTYRDGIPARRRSPIKSNRARRALTSFVRRTPLTTTPRRHEARWVWTVCLRLLPDSVATAIWIRAFSAWVQHANHSVTEPPRLLTVTTRSSAIAEGPRDASCQLKSCQLPRNSAETTYTTSPDQIDGMKLEI